MTEDEKQLTFDFFDPQEEITTEVASVNTQRIIDNRCGSQEETTFPRWSGVFVCSNGWFGVPGGAVVG